MRHEFFEPQAKALSDDSNVICPYCKYTYQPEAESYSEDTRTEECEGCGKKFHVWQVFTVDHHSKPDCALNGEEHEWDVLSNRRPDFQSCGKCDKLRRMPEPIPPSEKASQTCE